MVNIKKEPYTKALAVKKVLMTFNYWLLLL